MWWSHNTQIFQKSALIIKIQILNTPVFNCVLLISTFAFIIEKYYIVWRSCFFTINTNSSKFQVSWFNHVRIPPSKFWLSSWGHNPASGAQSLPEWSDLFSYLVNFDSHIYQNWDSGILKWLSHDTQIFQKAALIVKIQILNTPVFNCVLPISTFAFIIEKCYMYEEVAFSQLIQIHENFKYHDLITLEFRLPNSD